MLNHDLPRRFYFCKHIFVWIVIAIGSVHDERPAPAILELADFESIGETGWPPPPRQAFRIADRGKDLLYGCRDFTRCIECSHELFFRRFLKILEILIPPGAESRLPAWGRITFFRKQRQPMSPLTGLLLFLWLFLHRFRP